MSALEISEGMHFAMDPPRWMLPINGEVRLWTVTRVAGWEISIAPWDMTCIPATVTRSSFEHAYDKGAVRPCSIIERKPDQ